MAQNGKFRVAGRQISISNLDKVIFPAGAFTKEEMIEFYVRVSKYILPHLRGRPVSLKRYPDGVHGETFWEKEVPGFAPSWVKTFPVPRKMEKGVIHYILINDLPALVWCASISAIELHPFLHRVPHIEQPTGVVFDLDPGPGTDILTCGEVAFRLREHLAKAKLALFPKVSGSKGIQLWMPLNTPVDYEGTKAFARATAELLQEKFSDLVVADMAKVRRTGRVFIDWSQNIQTKTTVSVYSLRGKGERPLVSLPVSWNELRRALQAGRPDALAFEPKRALPRLDKVGDLYHPVLKLKQRLPEKFHSPLAPTQEPGPRSLEQYKAKRDFTKTAEPRGTPRRSAQGGKRRFVIQKHEASHLHFDLRLEMSQTLKSWAVPKGLPVRLEDRRSAFAVEDHPLDYLTFEGVIPAGEYGGGTVMVWDIGTYELLEGNYWTGRMQIYLKGVKLKGQWLLERQEDGEKPRWLITKLGKSIRLRSSDQDKSALSKRTMAAVARNKSATWHSSTKASPPMDGGKAKPAFVEPMLARKASKLPTGTEWIYEWKWDGVRTLALKDGDQVTLYSRNGRDQTSSFATVAEAIKTAHADQALIDGEIVAISEKGQVSFQRLQNRASLPKGWHIVFCAFDLLYLEGDDLRPLPLEQRKSSLNTVLERSGILVSLGLVGTVRNLVTRGQKAKREGIVAKRRDSSYQSGNRRDDWQKVQFKSQQEFVVGGYRPGGKSKLQLVLVGYYEQGKLLYAGKVRNGLNPFNRRLLFGLMHRLEKKKCPFTNLPNSHSDHFGESVTPEEMRDYSWVKPQVIVQVKFSEWTAGIVLRHAEFVAVRDDKAPREVTKEG